MSEILGKKFCWLWWTWMKEKLIWIICERRNTCDSLSAGHKRQGPWFTFAGQRTRFLERSPGNRMHGFYFFFWKDNFFSSEIDSFMLFSFPYTDFCEVLEAVETSKWKICDQREAMLSIATLHPQELLTLSCIRPKKHYHKNLALSIFNWSIAKKKVSEENLI